MAQIKLEKALHTLNYLKYACTRIINESVYLTSELSKTAAQ